MSLGKKDERFNLFYHSQYKSWGKHTKRHLMSQNLQESNLGGLSMKIKSNFCNPQEKNKTGFWILCLKF